MINFETTREISSYKITTKDLKNIEEYKNCKLPEDYKNFLLSQNGARSTYNTFDIKSCSGSNKYDGSDIQWFYGICSDTKSKMHDYDIFENMKCYSNRIPKELIPIANDSFGNNICLCVKGKNYGKIFFWDHENEAMAQSQSRKPWWSNIYFLASNFAEFVKNLYNIRVDNDNNIVITKQQRP